MSKPLHVLGFAGSLRKGSCNRAALRAAIELAPDDMTIETFDIGALPLYNADVEPDPEPVMELKARIAAADALLIVTPEYNYSLPGVLKNAIDWASRPPDSSPLNGKPLAMMGASPSLFGTVRARAHLRQVCGFNGMQPLAKPEVYITRAATKFDENGRLTDEDTRKFVAALLAALADWTLKLKGRSK